MPAGAVWTSAKKTALVEFLVENRSEAGDRGNFKSPTFPLKEGPVKTVKSARNKWTVFKKLFHIICMIQSVSGWVWDDEKSACIDADSASSWDAYVKKHPKAKMFCNKGWKHISNVMLIMPSNVSSAHVFHPTAAAPATINSSDHSASPGPDSPPKAASDPQEVEDLDHEENLPSGSQKHGHGPATPSHAAPKRVQASHGAEALQSMSTSLAGFSTAITAVLAPLVPVIDPWPICRTTAVAAVLHQEAESLTLTHCVALINFLSTNCTAADIYLALLTQPNVRKEWVDMQLKQLNIALF